MRYDPDNRKYYFSEEMVFSQKGKAEFLAASRAFYKECRSDPFGTYARTLDTRQEHTGITVTGLILSGAVILGVLALFACIAVKRYDIAGWIVAAIFAIIGISVFFTADKKTDYGFAPSPVLNRIQAVALILGGAGIAAVTLKVSALDGITCLLTLGFVISVVIFVQFVFGIIGFATGKNNVYTEEVDALCTGYLRTYDMYMSDHYTVTNSPIFEYRYDGTKYTACYDLFFPGETGKIPVGSTTKIKIDPHDPESIMGDQKSYASTPVIGAIICLILAGILGYMLFIV